MTPIGKATKLNTVTMSMNDLQSFLQSMDAPHNYIRSKTKQIQIRIYCITPKDKEYLQINMKRQTTQYKR